jgi:hypothetical protein
MWSDMLASVKVFLGLSIISRDSSIFGSSRLMDNRQENSSELQPLGRFVPGFSLTYGGSV